ncbi:MAG: hypothetical protein A3I07_03960 [Candidatus Doudnabacteria bacterium RIFCSPLOWO2_02_FULL_42_9]|uniref:Uncharacterized protein n=1 Tax=Candidatus Doudnabacteria bacterium RIFCSPHIGHO2_01_FULL_41_86 TaxID=1817821 RepID=A0A1F5N7J1_9BACT|nr:MAG: hypothetical protein A2717_03385 [Candidatus Doudnabacteria bacterium RIFCSPHIGHO2_01_FULL_41_86]OGE75665.1 MAG: hypothetical protein A3K07_00305 [Candidatus Doudnabacteria bacterium RIFCSPHIGHO2_01_43_10]OGE85687.1 MAG: hypothetical protein A3E28_02715 [Candidatus Doudnabacteria bacterium RIFCSPHIGHO2_12_FULL_42_22]OGE87182.1 MAG: hypothetical protein A3C49_00345 [Candidatus Doudnabacteria bacterium RIFCSPHIGHO2_02_FULL_42_25]OGE92020.1 MAG: hypothetical protein A2895_00220 [Candidatus
MLSIPRDVLKEVMYLVDSRLAHEVVSIALKARNPTHSNAQEIYPVLARAQDRNRVVGAIVALYRLFPEHQDDWLGTFVCPFVQHPDRSHNSGFVMGALPGLFFGIAAICEAGTRKNDDGYFVEKACRLISDRYGLRAEEFDELSLGLLENAVRQYAHHANPTEVDRIIRSSASSRLDEVGATILDSMSYARFRALNTNDRARSIIAVTTK